MLQLAHKLPAHVAGCRYLTFDERTTEHVHVRALSQSQQEALSSTSFSWPLRISLWELAQHPKPETPESQLFAGVAPTAADGLGFS